MKSRLLGRMRQMQEQNEQADMMKAQGRAALAVQQHIQENGDALEFAARFVLEAPAQRNPALKDESEEFEIGFRTACLELAYILRLMKTGSHSNALEFETLRQEAHNQALANRSA